MQIYHHEDVRGALTALTNAFTSWLNNESGAPIEVILRFQPDVTSGLNVQINSAADGGGTTYASLVNSADTIAAGNIAEFAVILSPNESLQVQSTITQTSGHQLSAYYKTF